MRRQRFAALALLAALAAVALPVALSGGPQARAAGLGTWVPGGAPVHGSVSTARPPQLAVGRSYRDTLAKGDSKYYAVRLDATSAAYLSVFAIPRPGSAVAFLDGISLRLLGTDGALCDTYDARFGADGATAPVGGAVRRVIRQDGTCRRAGTYLLVVQRDSADTSGSDVWPLDIRYLSEPGLAGAGAGDPGQNTVQSFASSPPPAVTGTPRPLTGAAAMDDGAQAPGTGVYTDRLLPGQTRYYRIPVDWGQTLSATAELSAAHLTRPGGFTGDGLRIAVYNPARGYAGGDAASYTGERAEVTAQTPAVEYANRDSSDPRVNGAPVAGWYYVQVSLHPAVAGFTTGSIPVTLRLAVTGTPRPAPHYATSLTGTGFGVAGATPPTPSGPGTPAATRLRALGYGALGAGTVLVAGLAVWALRGRRGHTGRPDGR